MRSVAGSRAGERLRRKGSRRSPRQGMGSGFFGEFNRAAPCGNFLSGLPADLCRAFQHFRAVPHGTSLRRLPALPCCAPGRSMSRLWRFPALGSGEGGGGGGNPGSFGGLRRYGLPGMGAPVARQGSGRSPAAWDGFGIFQGIQFMLRLPALFCGACGLSLRRSHALCLRPIRAVPFGASLGFARS